MTSPAAPLTDEELSAIIARAEKATPGPWEADSQDSYDNHGRCFAYSVFGADGNTLVDTLNSDAAEIHEEPDEHGVRAWDEIGRRNVQFIAAAREDIPRLVCYIRLLQEQLATLEIRDAVQGP